ncbi:flagellar assembly protein H [Oceanobacillus picturae]|uniref:Flagellar assembly protein FliH n=1 Tax=Oceanobacillus picturae TaxID=171693 RepID=W9B6F3_9BACI|nr:flagellar assembly protein FliH [Oceanobacillus picturae]RIU96369.1 flagellar assembly protein FliH [Oceanobacillus picturae]CDO02235.1 flagellar assembly protein H [Oceanobacillus picturae]
MISLSDSNVTGGKVIKIKPVITRNDVAAGVETEEQVQAELRKAQQTFEEVKENTAKMLQQTHDKIEQAKLNWEEEKKKLVEQAKRDGYQDGFNSGRDEGLLVYQTKLDELNQLTERAMKEFQQTVEKSTDEIINIALNTAEKIIDQKITEEPTSFLHIVNKAIKELKDQSIISIYLNPANYEFVVQQKEELLQILDDDTKLAIYIKDTVEENGCRIQHPFGELDIGIDTQLKQIREVLHEIVLEQKQ